MWESPLLLLLSVRIYTLFVLVPTCHAMPWLYWSSPGSTTGREDNVEIASAVLQGTSLYFKCMMNCFKNSMNLEVNDSTSCTGNQEMKELHSMIQKARPSDDQLTNMLQCLQKGCRLQMHPPLCEMAKSPKKKDSNNSMLTETITIVPECSSISAERRSDNPQFLSDAVSNQDEKAQKFLSDGAPPPSRKEEAPKFLSDGAPPPNRKEEAPKFLSDGAPPPNRKEEAQKFLSDEAPPPNRKEDAPKFLSDGAPPPNRKEESPKFLSDGVPPSNQKEEAPKFLSDGPQPPKGFGDKNDYDFDYYYSDEIQKKKSGSKNTTSSPIRSDEAKFISKSTPSTTVVRRTRSIKDRNYQFLSDFTPEPPLSNQNRMVRNHRIAQRMDMEDYAYYYGDSEERKPEGRGKSASDKFLSDGNRRPKPNRPPQTTNSVNNKRNKVTETTRKRKVTSNISPQENTISTQSTKSKIKLSSTASMQKYPTTISSASPTTTTVKPTPIENKMPELNETTPLIQKSETYGPANVNTIENMTLTLNNTRNPTYGQNSVDSASNQNVSQSNDTKVLDLTSTTTILGNQTTDVKSRTDQEAAEDSSTMEDSANDNETTAADSSSTTSRIITEAITNTPDSSTGTVPIDNENAIKTTMASQRTKFEQTENGFDESSTKVLEINSQTTKSFITSNTEVEITKGAENILTTSTENVQVKIHSTTAMHPQQSLPSTLNYESTYSPVTIVTDHTNSGKSSSSISSTTSSPAMTDLNETDLDNDTVTSLDYLTGTTLIKEQLEGLKENKSAEIGYISRTLFSTADTKTEQEAGKRFPNKQQIPDDVSAPRANESETITTEANLIDSEKEKADDSIQTNNKSQKEISNNEEIQTTQKFISSEQGTEKSGIVSLQHNTESTDIQRVSDEAFVTDSATVESVKPSLPQFSQSSFPPSTTKDAELTTPAKLENVDKNLMKTENSVTNSQFETETSSYLPDTTIREANTEVNSPRILLDSATNDSVKSMKDRNEMTEEYEEYSSTPTSKMYSTQYPEYRSELERPEEKSNIIQGLTTAIPDEEKAGTDRPTTVGLSNEEIPQNKISDYTKLKDQKDEASKNEQNGFSRTNLQNDIAVQDTLITSTDNTEEQNNQERVASSTANIRLVDDRTTTEKIINIPKSAQYKENEVSITEDNIKETASMDENDILEKEDSATITSEISTLLTTTTTTLQTSATDDGKTVSRSPININEEVTETAIVNNMTEELVDSTETLENSKETMVTDVTDTMKTNTLIIKITDGTTISILNEMAESNSNATTTDYSERAEPITNGIILEVNGDNINTVSYNLLITMDTDETSSSQNDDFKASTFQMRAPTTEMIGSMNETSSVDNKTATNIINPMKINEPNSEINKIEKSPSAKVWNSDENDSDDFKTTTVIRKGRSTADVYEGNFITQNPSVEDVMQTELAEPQKISTYSTVFQEKGIEAQNISSISESSWFSTTKSLGTTVILGNEDKSDDSKTLSDSTENTNTDGSLDNEYIQKSIKMALLRNLMQSFENNTQTDSAGLLDSDSTTTTTLSSENGNINTTSVVSLGNENSETTTAINIPSKDSLTDQGNQTVAETTQRSSSPQMSGSNEIEQDKAEMISLSLTTSASTDIQTKETTISPIIDTGNAENGTQIEIGTQIEMVNQDAQQMAKNQQEAILETTPAHANENEIKDMPIINVENNDGSTMRTKERNITYSSDSSQSESTAITMGNENTMISTNPSAVNSDSNELQSNPEQSPISVTNGVVTPDNIDMNSSYITLEKIQEILARNLEKNEINDENNKEAGATAETYDEWNESKTSQQSVSSTQNGQETMQTSTASQVNSIYTSLAASEVIETASAGSLEEEESSTIETASWSSSRPGNENDTITEPMTTIDLAVQDKSPEDSLLTRNLLENRSSDDKSYRDPSTEQQPQNVPGTASSKYAESITVPSTAAISTLKDPNNILASAPQFEKIMSTEVIDTTPNSKLLTDGAENYYGVNSNKEYESSSERIIEKQLVSEVNEINTEDLPTKEETENRPQNGNDGNESKDKPSTVPQSSAEKMSSTFGSQMDEVTAIRDLGNDFEKNPTTQTLVTTTENIIVTALSYSPVSKISDVNYESVTINSIENIVTEQQSNTGEITTTVIQESNEIVVNGYEKAQDVATNEANTITSTQTYLAKTTLGNNDLIQSSSRTQNINLQSTESTKVSTDNLEPKQTSELLLQDSPSDTTAAFPTETTTQQAAIKSSENLKDTFTAVAAQTIISDAEVTTEKPHTIISDTEVITEKLQTVISDAEETTEKLKTIISDIVNTEKPQNKIPETMSPSTVKENSYTTEIAELQSESIPTTMTVSISESSVLTSSENMFITTAVSSTTPCNEEMSISEQTPQNSENSSPSERKVSPSQSSVLNEYFSSEIMTASTQSSNIETTSVNSEEQNDISITVIPSTESLIASSESYSKSAVSSTETMISSTDIPISSSTESTPEIETLVPTVKPSPSVTATDSIQAQETTQDSVTTEQITTNIRKKMKFQPRHKEHKGKPALTKSPKKQQNDTTPQTDKTKSQQDAIDAEKSTRKIETTTDLLTTIISPKIQESSSNIETQETAENVPLEVNKIPTGNDYYLALLDDPKFEIFKDKLAAEVTDFFDEMQKLGIDFPDDFFDLLTDVTHDEKESTSLTESKINEESESAEKKTLKNEPDYANRETKKVNKDVQSSNVEPPEKVDEVPKPQKPSGGKALEEYYFNAIINEIKIADIPMLNLEELKQIEELFQNKKR